MAANEFPQVVQELESELQQEFQALHERCNLVQDALDDRVFANLRRCEQRLADHDLKLEQLFSDGQDCTARIEEHEVRFGVTRSKLDASDQRMALLSDRVDRALRLERVTTSTSEIFGGAALTGDPADSGRKAADHSEGPEVIFPAALEHRLRAWEGLLQEIRHQRQPLMHQTQLLQPQQQQQLHTGSTQQQLDQQLSPERQPPSIEPARLDGFERALEVLRQESAQRSAELARRARSGFAELRGHLDVISGQLTHLNERVLHTEEERLYARQAASQEAMIEVSRRLTSLEAKSQDDSLMAKALHQSLALVKGSLFEIKQAIDVVLLQRGCGSLPLCASSHQNQSLGSVPRSPSPWCLEALGASDSSGKGLAGLAGDDKGQDPASVAAAAALVRLRRELEEVRDQVASFPPPLEMATACKTASLAEASTLAADERFRELRQQLALCEEASVAQAGPGPSGLLEQLEQPLGRLAVVEGSLSDLKCRVAALSTHASNLVAAVEGAGANAELTPEPSFHRLGAMLCELPQRLESVEGVLQDQTSASRLQDERLGMDLNELRAEDQRLGHAIEQQRRLLQRQEQTMEQVVSQRRSVEPERLHFLPAEHAAVLQRLERTERMLEEQGLALRSHEHEAASQGATWGTEESSSAVAQAEAARAEAAVEALSATVAEQQAELNHCVGLIQQQAGEVSLEHWGGVASPQASPDDHGVSGLSLLGLPGEQDGLAPGGVATCHGALDQSSSTTPASPTDDSE